MEVGTRRIPHHNVTAHPTADWILRALPGDHSYRFLIHERDSIFSKELDRASQSSQESVPASAATDTSLPPVTAGEDVRAR
jgi:hypothetical protein